MQKRKRGRNDRKEGGRPRERERDRNEKKKTGENREGRNSRKRGGRSRERDRNEKKKTRENRGGRNGRKRGGKPRERETDSVERETTETVETKNQGYRQGDRERQTGRRKKKDRRGKPAGKEDTDWCLYTAEKKHHRCDRASQSPPSQHHRERSPASPSAQPSEIIASGNSLPPHSRRPLFIFLLAERGLCTFCIQEE